MQFVGRKINPAAFCELEAAKNAARRYSASRPGLQRNSILSWSFFSGRVIVSFSKAKTSHKRFQLLTSHLQNTFSRVSSLWLIVCKLTKNEKGTSPNPHLRAISRAAAQSGYITLAIGTKVAPFVIRAFGLRPQSSAIPADSYLRDRRQGPLSLRPA